MFSSVSNYTCLFFFISSTYRLFVYCATTSSRNNLQTTRASGKRGRKAPLPTNDLCLARAWEAREQSDKAAALLKRTWQR